MTAGNTDDTRAVLAGLIGVPVEDVLHFAIIVRCRQNCMSHQFCGLPDDAIALHAMAIQSLAVSHADFELAKLAAGCTACED